MQQWEYLTVSEGYASGKYCFIVNGKSYEKTIELPEYMNQLGNTGWELVSVASDVSARGVNYGTSDTVTKLVHYFKRPKP